MGYFNGILFNIWNPQSLVSINNRLTHELDGLVVLLVDIRIHSIWLGILHKKNKLKAKQRILVVFIDYRKGRLKDPIAMNNGIRT